MPLALCLALWLALLASPAYAADPIMPLEQVQPGMQCEGRSVFRGTAIDTFDVEILDVIEQAAPGSSPAILFRAFGPAIDATGLGFGFSGSPIYCPDANGVLSNAGAVFAGVEDYGNDTALATPIESILSMPVSAPPQARPATEAERNAEPWSAPLTVAGAGPAVRRALWSAAAKRDIVLISAPATASQVATGTDLQPGSAVAASASSGAVGLNAIGTVAYRDDAGRLWGFGHPLDSAGQRSLLMQGAYVHRVIANPNPPGINLGTYKLASAGDLAGTVDFDGNFAISGTLGALPTTIPVVVRASGPTGNPLPETTTLVADESPLNHPSGFASLSLATSIAVADRVLVALGSSSGRSYGRLCMRIDIQEREAPMRFCNRYVGDGQFLAGSEIAMGGDATTATTLIERFDRSQLHVDLIRTTLDVHEGMRFAVLRDVSGPRRATAGERIRVRIKYQRPREALESSTFRVRVPRSLRPGRRTLRLTGTGPDPGDASFDAIFGAGLSPEESFADDGLSESIGSVQELARAIAHIHRYDGIRATFRKRRDDSETLDELIDLFGISEGEAAGKPVFRHDELRIGGTARLKLRVVR
jgi:hypothetical protein